MKYKWNIGSTKTTLKICKNMFCKQQPGKISIKTCRF